MNCLLLWVGIAVVILLVIGALLLPWWSRMQFYERTTEQAIDRIARYQRLLESGPQLQRQLEILTRKIGQSGYFIREGSPELAAADLQNRIKKIVSSAGGKLISTQNVGSDGEGPLKKINIKVRMKGDVTALAKVLHSLSDAAPRMVVEDIALRSRRTIKGRRKNRVEGYELDATFTLSGYLLEEKG